MREDEVAALDRAPQIHETLAQPDFSCDTPEEDGCRPSVVTWPGKAPLGARMPLEVCASCAGEGGGRRCM